MSAARAGRERRSSFELVTPEGVPLRFTLASVGDRFIAFVYDLLLCGLILLALALLAALAGAGAGGGDWLGAFVVFAAFVLRMFYFSLLEIRWHGTTWGKRRLRLRVIDRHGGTLRADAVFARNFLREIEVFLPLAALFAPETLFPSATGLTYLVAIGWIAVVALMPLFNAQRLRPGDLVAGTMVVVTPQTLLLSDLSEERVRRHQEPRYTFTERELEQYGVYELQVLEELLRGRGEREPGAYGRIVSAIQRKIGRPVDTSVNALGFLHDFYDAQRAHLERRMVMGKRREKKRQ